MGRKTCISFTIDASYVHESNNDTDEVEDAEGNKVDMSSADAARIP
jgi:hypothetical protein